MSIILIILSERQEDCHKLEANLVYKSQASQSYIARHCLKKSNQAYR